MSNKTKVNPGNIVFLRGRKTILRPPLESDIPLFLIWFNDPEIREFITIVGPTQKHKISPAVQLALSVHTNLFPFLIF